MAQLPVEIVVAGEIPQEHLTRAISIANTVQDEVGYSLVTGGAFTDFAVHTYERARAQDLLGHLADIRSRALGYHPYLIGFVDSVLDGEDYHNIFGSDDAANGLAVFTTANVPDLIIPASKLSAYFLYYLAKSSFSFLAPGHQNHDDTRRCAYDRKVNKRDIVQSMRARALCDGCRRALLPRIAPIQIMAMERMFRACGDLLNELDTDPRVIDARPRVFVGSSTGGLPLARELKRLLDEDARIDVWDEGTVFGLGDSTLEALERAVLSYDFGVFVFTPDDEVVSRGQTKSVARDNVVFEMGLFVGKLTRRRAFAVCPAGIGLTLPSDLAGITTARYSAPDQGLSRAAESVCALLRRAMRQVLAPNTT
jgi:hypothetical protein